MQPGKEDRDLGYRVKSGIFDFIEKSRLCQEQEAYLKTLEDPHGHGRCLGSRQQCVRPY